MKEQTKNRPNRSVFCCPERVFDIPCRRSTIVPMNDRLATKFANEYWASMDPSPRSEAFLNFLGFAVETGHALATQDHETLGQIQRLTIPADVSAEHALPLHILQDMSRQLSQATDPLPTGDVDQAWDEQSITLSLAPDRTKAATLASFILQEIHTERLHVLSGLCAVFTVYRELLTALFFNPTLATSQPEFHRHLNGINPEKAGVAAKAFSILKTVTSQIRETLSKQRELRELQLLTESE